VRDSRCDDDDEDDDEAMLEGLIPELRPLPGVTDPDKAPFRFAAFGESGRFIHGGANSITDAKQAAEDAFRDLGPDAKAATASDQRDQRLLFLGPNNGWLKGSSRE
jgi:hypothetical protein